MARGLATAQQRRAGPWHCRVGDAVQAVGRLPRLLAARSRRRDQPPNHNARGPDAPNRPLRPVERTEQRHLDEIAAAVISHRYAFDEHDPLGEIPRRHWLRRVYLARVQSG